MNEYIKVTFRKNGAWLKVARQVPERGIELEERDLITRSVYIGFDGSDDITRYRMRRIRQVNGWDPGQFNLSIAAEGGFLVLRGVNPDALPEGRYNLRVRLEEADARQSTRVTVVHDGFAEHVVDLTLDDREVVCDADAVDLEIARVLGASAFDGQSAVEWINDSRWRATKKACLLNLLASLRVRPTLDDALIADVEEFFWITNDRGYARVHADLYGRLEALALDDDKFYREGSPHDSIHQRLLGKIPDQEKPFFPVDCLVSFRAEGTPSLQAVVAKPPVGWTHTYVDFDLDLGNPLQDVEGFVVHMLELADGKPTNHLDLYKDLFRTATREFLYYRVTT